MRLHDTDAFRECFFQQLLVFLRVSGAETCFAEPFRTEFRGRCNNQADGIIPHRQVQRGRFKEQVSWAARPL